MLFCELAVVLPLSRHVLIPLWMEEVPGSTFHCCVNLAGILLYYHCMFNSSVNHFTLERLGKDNSLLRRYLNRLWLCKKYELLSCQSMNRYCGVRTMGTRNFLNLLLLYYVLCLMKCSLRKTCNYVLYLLNGFSLKAFSVTENLHLLRCLANSNIG